MTKAIRRARVESAYFLLRAALFIYPRPEWDVIMAILILGAAAVKEKILSAKDGDNKS